MQYLSERLSLIHDMVDSDVLMDVGSDHGKLIISLVKDKKIKFGYAIENKTGPYNRLVENIQKENLLDKITPLFSDGITDLKNDVDTVVIAGMGGFTMLGILEAHKEKLKNVKHIIVDPHNAIKDVRKGLVNLGFSIADENIIYEDDIYYEIIDFVPGKAEYSEEEYYFGPVLIKKRDKAFLTKWAERIDEIDSILDYHMDDISEERKASLQEERERILNIL